MKKIIFYISFVLLILGSLVTILVFNKNNKINSINNSVVYVESIDRDTIKNGSGFVYKVEGGKNYILTSYHVIEGYGDIYIYNNDKDKVKANILNYDEYTDIAILSIEDVLGLKAIDLGNSDKISKNDKVYAVGTPFEISNINTISNGKVTFKNKKITITTTHGSSNLDTIQVTAKVDDGNSGGPLLNKNGKVIGMMFIKKDELDGVSFALPINFIMNIVKQLENNELKRPNLGAIMCNSTNTELLNEYEIIVDNVSGIVLLEVSEDYPLYNAGLQKGDIITKFDTKLVNNVNELREELYKQVVGNIVSIEYYRDGIKYEVNLKL